MKAWAAAAWSAIVNTHPSNCDHALQKASSLTALVRGNTHTIAQMERTFAGARNDGANVAALQPG